MSKIELLTAKEWGEKRGIIDRRVRSLCQQGRVNGALKKGCVWLIPSATKVPESLTRGRPPKKIVK